MVRVWLKGMLAVAAIGYVTEGRAGDDYCDALALRLEPLLLYAVKVGCLTPACVTAFDPPPKDNPTVGVLPAGDRYRFIYIIGNSEITRSPFVVKAMYADHVRPARSEMPTVSLGRDGVKFACRLNPVAAVTGTSTWYSKYEAAAAFPEDGHSGGLRDVPYNSYDHYHRFGFTNRDDESRLDNFHVGYESDNRCYLTNDDRRRPYFLFTNLEDRPSFFARLAEHLNAKPVSEALAAGAAYKKISTYSRIEVRMSNYEKGAQQRGCVSFPVDGTHDVLDLQLVDLEWQIRGADSGPPAWQIQFVSGK